MTTKVLLADDSLTIQKVIKITLANEPFVVAECADANQLMDAIRKSQPQILFLDFSLSETKTGYELAKEIKDNFPSVKLLMMYGTFDTIEEDELKAAGVAAHIVKPFDSTKFVNLCRSLSQVAESFRENKSTKKNPLEQNQEIDVLMTKAPNNENLDDWNIDAPKIEELKTPVSAKIPNKKVAANPLLEQAQEWGIEIPGVINNDSDDVIGDIPPVMQSEPVKKTKTSQASNEKALPNDDDLEYPDVMSIMNEIDIVPTQETVGTKSKLIPMDDFKSEESTIEVDIDFSVDDSERVKSLEAQIAENEDDLWSIDDGASTDNVMNETLDQLPGPIEDKRPLDLKELNENDNFSSNTMLPPKKTMEVLKDIDALFPEEKTPVLKTQTHEFFEQDISHKTQSINVQNFDFEQFKQDIFNRLKPELTAMVRDLIQEEVQNQLNRNFSNEVKSVAWEVIPSLAENLIREEIESIKRNVN
jgi:CheY-like chemotaxis protein